MARFYAGKSVDKPRINLFVLEELKKLPDRYHVLVEFHIGRQIDFAIFTEDSATCLEVKDYKGTIKGTVNGDWVVTYSDGRVERICNLARRVEENPYLQARNSADELKAWIITNKSKIFQTLPHDLHDLKIFPTVVIPSYDPRSEIEQDNWCLLSRGIEELRRLTDSRTWQWNKPHKTLRLCGDDILRIAQLLDLQPMADVLAPPDAETPLESESSGTLNPAAVATYLENLDQWAIQWRESLWHGCYTTLEAKPIDLSVEGKLRLPSDTSLPFQKTAPVIQLLEENQKVILAGEAGAGKTTTLLHWTRNLIAKFRQGEISQVPVFISLNQLTPKADLIGLVHGSLVSKGIMIDLATVTKYLEDGRFYLLMDGVNEMNMQAIELGALNDLQNFVDTYNKNSIVLSTRSHGFINILGLPSIELQPLAKHGVRHFLESYLGAEKGMSLLEKLGGHHDHEWKRSGSLINLATNPLMLSMFVETYRYMGTIARDKEALLGRFIDVILAHRERSKRGRYPADLKKRLLGHLAYEMLAQDLIVSADRTTVTGLSQAKLTQLKAESLAHTDWTIDDILDELCLNGVLRQRGLQQIEWMHQLVQEYFSVQESDERFPVNRNDPYVCPNCQSSANIVRNNGKLWYSHGEEENSCGEIAVDGTWPKPCQELADHIILIDETGAPWEVDSVPCPTALDEEGWLRLLSAASWLYLSLIYIARDKNPHCKNTFDSRQVFQNLERSCSA